MNKIYLLLFVLSLLFSCKKIKNKQKQFALASAKKTGVTFSLKILQKRLLPKEYQNGIQV